MAFGQFRQVGGNPMGYINYTDWYARVEALARIAVTFDLNEGRVPYTAVGVKHGTVFGAGYDFEDPLEAIRRCISGNPQDLFGGLFGTNFPIDLAGAKIIRYHLLPEGSKARIIDGLIAPDISEEALIKLKRKDNACHFLVNKALGQLTLDSARQFRYIRGGFMTQPANTFVLNLKDPHVEMTLYGELTKQQRLDLEFADAICRVTKSNTFTLVKDCTLIGNGTNRGSRVKAYEQAIDEAIRNGFLTAGSVGDSDSFNPFPDAAERAIDAKVAVVFTPIGSLNDDVVIQTYIDGNIKLITIPNAVGRGFYGH